MTMYLYRYMKFANVDCGCEEKRYRNLIQIEYDWYCY